MGKIVGMRTLVITPSGEVSIYRGIDPWGTIFWQNGNSLGPCAQIASCWNEGVSSCAKMIELPISAVEQGHPRIVLFEQLLPRAFCDKCVVSTLILLDRSHFGCPVWNAKPIASSVILDRFACFEDFFFLAAGQKRIVSIPGLGDFVFLWNGERLKQV